MLDRNPTERKKIWENSRAALFCSNNLGGKLSEGLSVGSERPNGVVGRRDGGRHIAGKVDGELVAVAGRVASSRWLALMTMIST